MKILKYIFFSLFFCLFNIYSSTSMLSKFGITSSKRKPKTKGIKKLPKGKRNMPFSRKRKIMAKKAYGQFSRQVTEILGAHPQSSVKNVFESAVLKKKFIADYVESFEGWLTLMSHISEKISTQNKTTGDSPDAILKAIIHDLIINMIIGVIKNIFQQKGIACSVSEDKERGLVSKKNDENTTIKKDESPTNKVVVMDDKYKYLVEKEVVLLTLDDIAEIQGAVIKKFLEVKTNDIVSLEESKQKELKVQKDKIVDKDGKEVITEEKIKEFIVLGKDLELSDGKKITNNEMVVFHNEEIIKSILKFEMNECISYLGIFNICLSAGSWGRPFNLDLWEMLVGLLPFSTKFRIDGEYYCFDKIQIVHKKYVEEAQSKKRGLYSVMKEYHALLEKYFKEETLDESKFVSEGYGILERSRRSDNSVEKANSIKNQNYNWVLQYLTMVCATIIYYQEKSIELKNKKFEKEIFKLLHKIFFEQLGGTPGLDILQQVTRNPIYSHIWDKIFIKSVLSEGKFLYNKTLNTKSDKEIMTFFNGDPLFVWSAIGVVVINIDKYLEKIELSQFKLSTEKNLLDIYFADIFSKKFTTDALQKEQKSIAEQLNKECVLMQKSLKKFLDEFLDNDIFQGLHLYASKPDVSSKVEDTSSNDTGDRTELDSTFLDKLKKNAEDKKDYFDVINKLYDYFKNKDEYITVLHQALNSSSKNIFYKDMWRRSMGLCIWEENNYNVSIDGNWDFAESDFAIENNLILKSCISPMSLYALMCSSPSKVNVESYLRSKNIEQMLMNKYKEIVSVDKIDSEQSLVLLFQIMFNTVIAMNILQTLIKNTKLNNNRSENVMQFLEELEQICITHIKKILFLFMSAVELVYMMPQAGSKIDILTYVTMLGIGLTLYSTIGSLIAGSPSKLIEKTLSGVVTAGGWGISNAVELIKNNPLTAGAAVAAYGIHKYRGLLLNKTRGVASSVGSFLKSFFSRNKSAISQRTGL